MTAEVVRPRGLFYLIILVVFTAAGCDRDEVVRIDEPCTVFHFAGGTARWTDACGTDHVVTLSGGADTVGAASTVRFTWSGCTCSSGDVAEGEWSVSSGSEWTGGTLADSAFEFTFPPQAARTHVLDVTTNCGEAFSQTLIVNFSPLTMIVDPRGSSATPTPGLYFSTGDQVWPSGTTLPDGSYDVIVHLTGRDDSRDVQTSCGDPGVRRFQYRELFRLDSYGPYAGLPYANVSDPRVYPEATIASLFDLGSGDHLLQFRAIDDALIVDATPETVWVGINYPPYLTQLTIRGSQQTESEPYDLLAARNTSPSTPADVYLLQGENLEVTLLGRDVHIPNPLNPLPPLEPDPLAAAFDSTAVVGTEFGSLDPVGAYRVFFDSPLEPGYDSPAGGVEAPFVRQLAPPGEGIYVLIADVRDNPADAFEGRRGRIVRHLNIHLLP